MIWIEGSGTFIFIRRRRSRLNLQSNKLFRMLFLCTSTGHWTRNKVVFLSARDSTLNFHQHHKDQLSNSQETSISLSLSVSASEHCQEQHGTLVLAVQLPVHALCHGRRTQVRLVLSLDLTLSQLPILCDLWCHCTHSKIRQLHPT